MEFDIYTSIGLIGSFLFFFSYGLLNAEKVTGNSLEYIGMNLVASSCVLFSLFGSWNLASAVIQIGWIMISIYGIFSILRKERNNSMKNKEVFNKNNN